MVTTVRPGGKAYAVFRCSDSRPFQALAARFKDALENIKAAHAETGIPPETEFSVHSPCEGVKAALSMDGAEGLAAHVEALEKKGANFLIRSELPGALNEIAARDLGDTMNMLYGGTELFDSENEGRAPIVMDIFYQEKPGVFVSKITMDMVDERHCN